MILYHYTDEKNSIAIERDGCIRPSVDASGRASHRGPGGRHGAGVYLTDMDPTEHDRSDVARSNYRSGWQKNLAKTDRYVAVDVPEGDPRLRKLPGSGRNHLYEGRIDEEMFRSSGRNASWDPSAIVAAVAIGLGVKGLEYAASKYSSYQEQKRCEEAERARAIEERQKAELKSALELERGKELVLWKCLKKNPVPLDFSATSQHVGDAIERILVTTIRNVSCVALIILVGLGIASIRSSPPSFYDTLGLMAAVVTSFLMAHHYIDSDKPIDVARVVADEDQILFCQKEKPHESWFGRAISWTAGTNGPNETIAHRVEFRDRALGLVRVATLSLPLAASPDVERKYYSISILGRWYAVTAFHYVHSDPRSDEIQEE